MSSEIYFSALHESGHCIVSLALGWKFSSIEIDGIGGGLISGLTPGHKGKLPSEKIAILAAGYIAESMMLPSTPRATASVDDQYIDQILRAENIVKYSDQHKNFLNMAEMILKKHRDKLEILTNSLMAKKSLTYSEIKQTFKL